MNILKIILKYIYLIGYGVFLFFLMIIDSVRELFYKLECIDALMYQPIIAFVILIVLNPVESIMETYVNSREKLGTVVGLNIFAMIVLGITINAVIELVYYLINKGERYAKIFSMQKTFYNYALIVISLFAFWVAFDRSIDNSVNLELLICGCFSFLLIIFMDLYDSLVHKDDKVKKLYNELMRKKKSLFDK